MHQSSQELVKRSGQTRIGKTSAVELNMPREELECKNADTSTQLHGHDAETQRMAKGARERKGRANTEAESGAAAGSRREDGIDGSRH